MKWLKDNWIGTSYGNFVQKVWTQPTAHSMMDMFQIFKEDQITFYEIFHIIEKDGSLLFEFKHFNAELIGWEDKAEKVLFPLIKITEKTACFDGLTYKRIDNRLSVWVTIKQKDGSIIEGEFKFSLSD